MKIAFYSPLKSPNHAVPSGDRLMARQLIAALRMAGHEVEVASELRSFARTPDEGVSPEAAEGEIERLRRLWETGAVPDIWFTYHPYYKAPDMIGPVLAAEAGIAYVTAEASYSARRDRDGWAGRQALLAEGLRQAAINICMTRRDRAGLEEAVPGARFAMLSPFIEPAPFLAVEPSPQARRLVCVAMMRSGDKLDSFRMLAQALGRLDRLEWRLSIVGDGPASAEVRGAFASLPESRIDWLGERQPSEIAAILSQAALYVWPGCGEAYGLAYLEAQAAGLPVVAQATAGVPEVVMHGRTGVLTPAGDITAYAAAIADLLENDGRRQAMARAARDFVRDERSLAQASATLSGILETYVKGAR